MRNNERDFAYEFITPFQIRFSTMDILWDIRSTCVNNDTI